MAKTSLKVKQQRKPKFSTERIRDAGSAEDPTRYLENTEYAVYASESWPTREKFPA